MAVSLLGDGIFIVAVAWQAYAISDHPSALAYVGVATSVPQLVFLLVGGAVSDRLSRRTVLFWADIVRALAVGALAVVVAGRSARLYELCLAGAVIGTATAFASPSFDALVPQLVPGPELVQANAIEQFARPFALQLAGPAVGGVAVALLRPWGAFALDATSFVFSALCVRRMAAIDGYRVATGPSHGVGLGQEAGAGHRASLRREVGEGLRYVRSQVWLWGTFLSATFTYLLFIGPTQVLLPYIVRNSLHQGASTYGVVLAAGGVGALVGAVFSGYRPHPRRPMPWIYGWWTLDTLGPRRCRCGGKRGRGRRHRRLGHGQAAPGREQHVGPGVQYRLGHLDGPATAQLRPHGPGGGGPGCPQYPRRGGRPRRDCDRRFPVAARHARRRPGHGGRQRVDVQYVGIISTSA